jgi:hypothetical protein
LILCETDIKILLASTNAFHKKPLRDTIKHRLGLAAAVFGCGKRQWR